MNPTTPTNIFLPIVGTTFFRLVLNTARRFVYPFAPVLSRGLGVSLSAITSLIAINQVTSLLGAFIGPMSDRLGYRKMMIAGMAMLATGMLAAAIFPIYAVVLVAMFLAGLGKSIFDPAVQAWVGNRVPYRRRALVMGIMETSWSASTLIGIPLVAILMDRYGWQSPFLVMGGLGCIGAVALFFIIPDEPEPASQKISPVEYLGAYSRLIANKPALGALGYVFFISAANDNLFVVYGAWLEKSFGLGIVALGLGTSLIGVAELLGEGLTAAVSDRFGLKRALIAGLSLSVLSYVALPFLDTSLTAALTGLAILFFIFEFTMVTSLTLCTEILPGFRATMMSGFFATAGIGRMVGALMGGAVWQAGGILATGCTSGVLTFLGMLCLMRGLKGWRRTDV
ncbi:MFS transporter [Desulfosarcina sp.]|uniref:MFS transporter n=1 Tax=Desulfosarcina sp. TaxID=2027861 RepID=UPI0029A8E2F5|nr:MFS transporter [Desulfosarcina sp.]MDX2453737.1 MFS transporter [Desulfosarcina sp.]MDX2491435.1 MFS transporter [Desulfosarcina sp.]